MATKAEYALIGIMGTVAVGGILGTIGVIYVVVHFVLKFW